MVAWPQHASRSCGRRGHQSISGFGTSLLARIRRSLNSAVPVPSCGNILGTKPTPQTPHIDFVLKGPVRAASGVQHRKTHSRCSLIGWAPSAAALPAAHFVHLFLNPRTLACRERRETKCRVPGDYALVDWPSAELLLACVIAIGVMKAIGWSSKCVTAEPHPF
jgi:hypothetical protein